MWNVGNCSRTLDAVTGAATVILATGAGKKAASTIPKDLSADRETASAKLANTTI